jgi:hypothetical protein
MPLAMIPKERNNPPTREHYSGKHYLLKTRGRPIWVALFFIACAVVMFPGVSINQELETQSQCVACHANLKKLIRLCWEVEKIKPRPAQSAETSGEG